MARERRLARAYPPPFKLWELQEALHAKAKGNPSYRFHALYDKLCRQDVLAEAWRRCLANGGVAGVDGVSFEKIEACGVSGWLGELAQELRDNRRASSTMPTTSASSVGEAEEAYAAMSALMGQLANRLAASGFVLPHHITLDMPWSSSSPGDQSITQSDPPECEISGLGTQRAPVPIRSVAGISISVKRFSLFQALSP